VAIKTDKAGYAVIERVWKVCDVIELDLPMPPRLMVSHPRIDPARGSMAIERGPLVYCLESFDQPDGVNLMDVAIAREPHFETVWHDDLLGGVVVIKARGYALDAAAWGDDLYRAVGSHASFTRRPIGLTAIPYYAWDNRGLGAMRVWIAAENAA
jgi:hypothetical protein